MSNPDRSRIIGAHPRKVQPFALIGSSLASNGHTTDLGAATSTALYGSFQHIHQHPGRAGLIDLIGLLKRFAIQNDIAVAIRHLCKGGWGDIYALIGDGAKHRGHLHRAVCRRTERNAGARTLNGRFRGLCIYAHFR